jgi:hypothetical protein
MTRDGDLAHLVRSLDEAQQKGEGGSIGGFLYLIHPALPTPLHEWPVTLIPLTPTLEQAVIQAHAEFIRNGRAPLTADALDRVRRPIIAQIDHLEASGHKALIRTAQTETGTEPKFTFQDVPPGRWLLLAEFRSKISVLLWAVPVTVTQGEQTWQSLSDKNIWLEGLLADQR